MAANPSPALPACARAQHRDASAARQYDKYRSDIGAMAAALKLRVGGPAHLYAIAFGALSLLLQIFIPFPRYAPILKALTLALFACVATIFIVDLPWPKSC
jgi:hypothetical protein